MTATQPDARTGPVVRDLRLTQFGYPDVVAHMQARYQPRPARVGRSLASLGAGTVGAVALFFVPPHFPWVIGSLGAGIYFARRFWRGEYRVDTFEGACPRCSEPVQLSPGERVSFPTRITCFGCHHDVAVELI